MLWRGMDDQGLSSSSRVDGSCNPACTLTSKLKTHLRGEPAPRSELQPCLPLPTLRRKASGGLGKVKKQRKGHFPRDLPQGALLQGQPASNL